MNKVKKFFKPIVDHPKQIVIVFVIAAIICAFCKQWIKVDYDMNDYLPESSASTKALDLMEEEFDGGIPNARVMIRDVTIPQALLM